MMGTMRHFEQVSFNMESYYGITSILTIFIMYDGSEQVLFSLFPIFWYFSRDTDWASAFSTLPNPHYIKENRPNNDGEGSFAERPGKREFLVPINS